MRSSAASSQWRCVHRHPAHMMRCQMCAASVLVACGGVLWHVVLRLVNVLAVGVRCGCVFGYGCVAVCGCVAPQKSHSQHPALSSRQAVPPLRVASPPGSSATLSSTTDAPSATYRLCCCLLGFWLSLARQVSRRQPVCITLAPSILRLCVRLCVSSDTVSLCACLLPQLVAPCRPSCRPSHLQQPSTPCHPLHPPLVAATAAASSSSTWTLPRVPQGGPGPPPCRLASRPSHPLWVAATLAMASRRHVSPKTRCSACL
jgi:hypothetical protein